VGVAYYVFRHSLLTTLEDVSSVSPGT
jgi:hypothetical protein